MKIFIDSADTKEIREIAGWGILDGCTTNPSLVCKTGKPFKDCVKDILEIVNGPVSVEAISTDAAGMIKEGEEWARLDSREGHSQDTDVGRGPEGGRRPGRAQHQDQRDARLLAQPGAARLLGRGDVHQPVRGPARRHLARRDGAHPRTSSR